MYYDYRQMQQPQFQQPQQQYYPYPPYFPPYFPGGGGSTDQRLDRLERQFRVVERQTDVNTEAIRDLERRVRRLENRVGIRE